MYDNDCALNLDKSVQIYFSFVEQPGNEYVHRTALQRPTIELFNPINEYSAQSTQQHVS